MYCRHQIKIDRDPPVDASVEICHKLKHTSQAPSTAREREIERSRQFAINSGRSTTHEAKVFGCSEVSKRRTYSFLELFFFEIQTKQMPFHVRGKLRRNGSSNISGRIGGVPSDYGESTASDSLDPACIEGAVEAKKQYDTVYGSSSRINNGSATTATSSSTTSHIADKTMEFPRFRFEELTLGKVLGQGGFGKVYEIRSITCRESVTLTQLSQSDIGGYASSGGGGGCSNGGGGLNGHDSLCLEDLENNEDIDTSNESAEVHGFFSQLDEQNFKESRAFIAKHCLRQPSTNNINNDNSNHGGSSDGTKQLGSTGGSAKNLFSSSSNSGGGGGGGGGGKLGIKRKQQRDARYAIKFLKPEIIKNSNVYPSACYDMALETRVLSSIIHPNIIKLRAISSVPTFSKDYFFIMDRLYDTLEQRLEKWKRTMKRSNNVIGKLLFSDRTATKIETVTLDRMVSAYDLSSAIAYIHKQHIIYRDLVSDSVSPSLLSRGFDYSNVLGLLTDFLHMSPSVALPVET